MNKLIKNTLLSLAVTLPATLLTAIATPAQAALISIDWNTDNIPDGIATGTLKGFNVTLKSTNGPLEGGVAVDSNFNADWPFLAGNNNVPGITDPGIIKKGAVIDWNTGVMGSVNLAFRKAFVTNPIILINYTYLPLTFDFADDIGMVLLDQYPSGTVTIEPGNVVTTNGNNINVRGDGLSFQLLGSFTSIDFLTNLNLGDSESVGFSVAVDENNIEPTPEPSFILGFLAFTVLGLKLKRS